MRHHTSAELFDFLEAKYDLYNRIDFIELDPVSIPHRFVKKEDIEIAGFFAATIAWGQRTSILRNADLLMQQMDDTPYEFVMNHSGKDLKKIKNCIHRTFQGDDCVYFIQALRNIYQNHGGMENLLRQNISRKSSGMREAISAFRAVFFELPHLPRTEKHVSNPLANSAAKRINMFLRWMVRKDSRGVDFGIWESVSPSELYCPLDVHSGTVARKLHILQRKQDDWKAVAELTANLRRFDAEDPVKYDFALFGLGINEKF